MGNIASRKNDHERLQSKNKRHLNEKEAKEKKTRSSNCKRGRGEPIEATQEPTTTIVTRPEKPITKNNTNNAAEEEQQQQQESAAQRLKQTSTWSLGSLSGRLNWSFTGAGKNSFRNRNKSTRKSLPCSLQQRQQQRSKTTWHRPLTNSIFSSHFKESSRNEEFHIESLIAKGAFGVVFKVSDKEALKRQQKHLQQLKHFEQNQNKQQQKIDAADQQQTVYYALKVLKKSKIIEDNSIQQIKEEADIQKLCGHHSFIVQQVDLWQNRRNLHILSEYVPNGELFSTFAHFSIDLVRLYLAEIALAIDFLHNAGIIYRDAKPENILLTKNYHIKLIDFGLSKWLKLGATTKTMCGTLQYMGTN